MLRPCTAAQRSSLSPETPHRLSGRKEKSSCSIAGSHCREKDQLYCIYPSLFEEDTMNKLHRPLLGALMAMVALPAVLGPTPSVPPAARLPPPPPPTPSTHP